MSGDLATVVVTESVTTIAVDAANKISSQAVMTDNVFYLLLVVPLIVALGTSQYSSIRDRFYDEVFAKSRIKPYMMMLFLFAIDILVSTSLTFYIWNFKNPLTGEPTNRYVSIESIWFTTQAFKAFWSILFWTFGDYFIALIISLILMCCIDLMCLVLAGLLISEAVTVGASLPSAAAPPVLILVAFAGYLAVTIFNGNIMMRANKEIKKAKKAEKDEQMLIQLREKDRAQQQQQRRQEPQDYTEEEYAPYGYRSPITQSPSLRSVAVATEFHSNVNAQKSHVKKL